MSIDSKVTLTPIKVRWGETARTKTGKQTKELSRADIKAEREGHRGKRSYRKRNIFPC